MTKTKSVTVVEEVAAIEPSIEPGQDFATLLRGTNGQQVLLQPVIEDGALYLQVAGMYAVNGELVRAVVHRDDMDVTAVLKDATDGEQADAFLDMLRQAILDYYQEKDHDMGHVHGPDCHHG